MWRHHFRTPLPGAIRINYSLFKNYALLLSGAHTVNNSTEMFSKRLTTLTIVLKSLELSGAIEVNYSPFQNYVISLCDFDFVWLLWVSQSANGHFVQANNGKKIFWLIPLWGHHALIDLDISKNWCNSSKAIIISVT